MIDNVADSEEGSLRLITSWLSSFACAQNHDIEYYLHNRAIKFENLGKSRTYLVCDKNVLRTGELYIFGFFTVSLKVLDLPESLSNHKRLKLDGFAAKIHGDPIKSIPCYLIGQLAKNSAIQNTISGKELVQRAISVIKSAAADVGGRYILVECQDNPHLRKFYEDNGFNTFDAIPEGNVPMIQMIRPIY